MKLPYTLLILPLLLCPLVSRGADPASVETGRKLHADLHSAVVTISAVLDLQISVTGQGNKNQEQEVEVFGTVLNEKGLIVVSNSSLDVSGQIIRGAKGKLPPGTKLDVKVDFKEVKIITDDGDEIPAQIVLKDADLDLAFIRPDESTDEGKAAKFASVKLNEPAPEAQLMDEVFLIERLGKDLNRLVTINTASIIGILKKPRLLYLVNDQNAGTPVFNKGGNFLGIFGHRIFEGGPASVVIIPVQTVAEIAKQAETAQPIKPNKDAPGDKPAEEKDEPKEAAPKPTEPKVGELK